MTFFTIEEFNNEYNINLPNNELWKLKKACNMIYSQVGTRYRNPQWDDKTCPPAIKEAAMEQLRFIIEYDIPSLDVRGTIKAGAMESDLKTDYSLDALRILANNGYLYRGNPLNYNMGLNIPFGD